MADQTPNGTARPRSQRLTQKQRLFVHFYLNEAEGKSSLAARMAGYGSPEANCTRLMESEGIKSALAERADQTMPRSEVLIRMRDLAETDMADYAGLVGETDAKVIRKELRRLKRRGLSHRIKRLMPTRNGLSVDVANIADALVRLGQAHGLFAERHIHSQDLSDLENKSLEELRELDDKINGKPKRLGNR
jgi:hypothetical protein